MITYPINMPNSDPAASIMLQMRDIVGASESPYTGKGQYIDYMAGSWGLTITIPPVGREEGQKWLAFLAKLRGRIGTFQCPVPGHSVPLGSARDVQGVPRVTGNEDGYVIEADGMPASTFEYLAEGDFIQIGIRLYVITQRVNTNALGAASLNVWPSADGHANNTPIIVSNPMGLFRLESDVRDLNVESFDTYGCIITAKEA